MPELVLAVPDPAALTQTPTAELWQALREALQVTADRLRYAATLWRELERRGENLGALRGGIGRWLAKIAAGVLLPELVVKYLTEPGVLRRAATLPAGEQQKLLDTGKLPWAPRKMAGQGPRRVVALRDQEGDEDGQPQAVDAAGDRRQLTTAASLGSPGDVAETILDMVRGCSDPRDVAVRILPALQRLVEVPRPPLLHKRA